MKIRTPDYFDEFKCIADKCKDTCCAGWGIVIDDESYNKYLSIEGQFGDELRSKIISDEDDNVFVLNGDRCSFLNDSNLCVIYNELGQEGLCYTCRQYPRYHEEFGNLREIGISLSCPEAARIILSKNETVKFNLVENYEEVNKYNDINPNIYINLMQCRKTVFDILQDRNIELIDRCTLILLFINEVQEKIDSNDKYGEFIIVEHKSGYESLYSNITVLDACKEGSEVEQGEVLGYVAESFGFEVEEETHLHFELKKDDKYIGIYTGPPMSNGQPAHPTNFIT